jgi:hypothetical protein
MMSFWAGFRGQVMTLAAGWHTSRIPRTWHALAFMLVCFIGLAFPACTPATTSLPGQRMMAPSSREPAESNVPLQVPRAAVPVNERPIAPVRLIIPRIGLNAAILALGPDPNGAMQAPQRGRPHDPVWSEVYWWKVGAIPGQSGNAVIAGHVNRPDGSPSTFTRLNELRVGDLIEVKTEDGQLLTFRVTEKAAPSAYVRGGNDPTMGRIFGPALEPHLNLLTCWGAWDGKEYNRRLVIYSTLVRSATITHSPENAPDR